MHSPSSFVKANRDPTLAAEVAAGAMPACVINCVQYDKAGKRHDITLAQISDVLADPDGGFVWVGLYEPQEGLLAILQEEFGLHDLAIEDATVAHQRPKIEAYGNSLFLAVHTAQVVEGQIRYGETHAFVGPRFFVTVRHGASLSYAPARARVEREPLLLALGPAYALYAVLDAIVDNYLPIVAAFTDSLVSAEKEIFADTYQRHTVVKLYDLKRQLTEMRLSVAPLQDVMAQLTRTQGGILPIPEEVRLYYRDVHDHVLRVNEHIDTLREMLTTALSVNLSMVTLGQGETVKRLGAWAALLAAPTLITSWYGMNFQYMPELHTRHGYGVMVVVVALVCTGLYLLFKRVKWL